MAESEATTFGSFSESDGDSILSGSVCYSTDLSEDSKAESDLSEEVGGEVLPYRFKPERRSGTYSESGRRSCSIDKYLWGRKNDWYVIEMYFVAFSSPGA